MTNVPSKKKSVNEAPTKKKHVTKDREKSHTTRAYSRLIYPYSDYMKWSPIRRMMKDNGADIVARDAVIDIIQWTCSNAELITKTALRLAKHAKRKKINREDILLAIKYI